MRFIKSCLAGLLITSLTLGAAGASLPENTKTEGAGTERELGRGLLLRGRAGEALVHLENALKAFQQSGDRAGEASTRDLLGELYERQGRYDIAQEQYTVAQNLYAAGAKGPATPAAPGGRLPGGRVSADVTQGATAAAGLSGEESAYNARLMLAKIGNMLYRRGEYDEARVVFERMNVTKPDTSALGKVKRAKGILGAIGASVGSDDRSIRVGAPSLGGLITLKDQLNFYRRSIIYAADELGLGRIDYRQGRFAEARGHFENVLDATNGDLAVIGKLGQTRRYRAAARTSLGDVALRQGNFKEAEELYEKAVKGAREDRREDLVWPALLGQGRASLRQAEAERDRKKADRLRDKSLDSYREALASVEKLRQGSISADESRTTFLATTAEVYEETTAALAEAALSAQPSAASGSPLEGQALAYASEALATVERGRARSLLDLLNESGAEITEGVPEDLLREKRENQTRQAEVAAELTGVELGGAEKRKKPEELEEELDQLQDRLDSIENRIRTKSPRYAQLTAAGTLTLEEIRRQVLDEETALLEYGLGEGHSYLFAVTRDRLSIARLPGREEVERLVVDFRQQLIPTPVRRSIIDLVAAAVDPQRGLKVATARPDVTPAAVQAYADAAHALYKALVEPAAPLYRRSRLLVVADGALNYVPFDALVTQPPAAGADFSALEYLLKQNETVFAPSASVLAAVRQTRGAVTAATAAGNLLVVADPVFDPADSRAVAALGPSAAQQSGADAGRAPGFDSAVADVSGGLKASGGKRVALVRLAGTQAEAEEIKSLAARAGRKADVWLGLDANEGELEARDLRGYRVLHFATHGILNAERPQFTGLVLSLVGNRGGADGFLRTDEVFNLKLGSPLVMLSACETGLGREKRGEGVMGLARAFMYAGAPTVGVTLWSVADKPTAELMSDFYQSLLAQRPATPSAAMRAARLSLLARKETSAPYFWAPFVLVGDWK
ncbi:MAG: CHAT domain-containing protein [Acidobacteria bacterium]|nr:CHAT domain-containing protein [Acidobacteriota bacterium]